MERIQVLNAIILSDVSVVRHFIVGCGPPMIVIGRESKSCKTEPDSRASGINCLADFQS